MLEFAKGFFEQQVQVGSASGSVGAHLRQAAKTLGLPSETFAPEGSVPPGLEQVWQIFGDLSACRSMSAFSANPIAYGEILAWSILNGIELDPWQVATVKKLDGIWLEIIHARSRRTQSGN